MATRTHVTPLKALFYPNTNPTGVGKTIFAPNTTAKQDSGRKNTIFSSQVEDVDKGSCCVKYCKRTRNPSRMQTVSSVTVNFQSKSSKQRRFPQRNSGTPSERSHTKVASSEEGFYSHMFLVPQKGGLLSSSYRLKSVKQVHIQRTFSNGRVTPIENYSKPGKLYDQNRSQRCLSVSPDQSQLETPPEVHCRQPDLPIPLPTIWSQHSPKGLHKAAKTHCNSLALTRSSHDCVPRRHPPSSYNKNRHTICACDYSQR